MNIIALLFLLFFVSQISLLLYFLMQILKQFLMIIDYTFKFQILKECLMKIKIRM